MHPFIYIFDLEIPVFGLMIAIGVLCFSLLSLWLFRKHGIDEKTIDYLIIICAISGAMFAIGASIFDSLWHNIAEYKKNGTFTWKWAGITYSGGLLTAIITYIIVYIVILKNERHTVFNRLDLIVIGLCIAHGFGRIGCYFGGCCYGKEVPAHTFLSVYYPTDYGFAWVLPTQLYESFFLFALAIVLFFVVKKNRTAWYLIGYNTFRFFLEYLRGDSRGDSPFSFLTPSQFLSIIMLIGGIVLLVWRGKIENWLLKRNKDYKIYLNMTQDAKTTSSSEGDN